MVIQKIFLRLRSEAIHNLGPTFVSICIPKSFFYNGYWNYYPGNGREGRDLSKHPYLALRSEESRMLSLIPLCVTRNFTRRTFPMFYVLIHCLKLALLQPTSVSYNTPAAFIFVSSFLRAFYAVCPSTTQLYSYKVDRWQCLEKQNRRKFSTFCFIHRPSHLID